MFPTHPGAAAIASLALILGACHGEPTDPPCEDGAWTCSEDGDVLRHCEQGAWQETRCQMDLGQLCEQGTCVDPWRYGAPTWDACEDDPLAVNVPLAQKMADYEDLARRVHVHPPLKWMLGVSLACRPRACSVGETPPCQDCTQPAVSQDDATSADVAAWHTGENDRLWSGLYLTSQAYRYAVTHDASSLAMIVLLLEGERDRMAITGVPGLFTRQLIPPNVPGIACPSDPARYVPDPDHLRPLPAAPGSGQREDRRGSHRSIPALHRKRRRGARRAPGRCDVHVAHEARRLHAGWGSHEARIKPGL